MRRSSAAALSLVADAAVTTVPGSENRLEVPGALATAERQVRVSRPVSQAMLAGGVLAPIAGKRF